MAIGWLRWLAIPFLVLGLALAACGGGDEEEKEGQPTPTATVEEEATLQEEVEAGPGEAFADVPVPGDADETASGSWSGSLPFAVPSEDIDPEQYSTIEYKEYKVDASPQEVMNFYRDKMDGWDEVFFFTGGEAGEEGGVGAWTRDGGRTAVWVAANQADGESDLFIMLGTSD